MRPIVRDAANEFDRQTHAYAEFRLFSRLAAERVSVASAVVTLRRAEVAASGPARTTCWITVVTSDGTPVHAKASEPHPYAAIDRAVAEVTTMVAVSF
jgi:ribosome-associated translation inhibitor RaiA